MNKKKIIAPVIVVICLAAYYSVFAALMIKYNLPGLIKILGIIFSAAVTITLVFVLVERIKEIKNGEEDDLGKY